MNNEEQCGPSADPCGPGIVKVRIMPDGRVCFDVMPADVLQVAAALCPDDPMIRRRLVRARRLGRTDRPEPTNEGC
jgi:hypothetical protein